MALNILSFSVNRVQDSGYGVTALQPSWADQPWPYKFSVSKKKPSAFRWLVSERAPSFLEGGRRLGTRWKCTMEARHS